MNKFKHIACNSGYLKRGLSYFGGRQRQEAAQLDALIAENLRGLGYGG